jgi:hypothetical protein
MHIIFGDAPTVMSDSYTLLELDTFNIPSKNQNVKAFCVVTQIPLDEYGIMENNKKIHADLIAQYRLQNWEFCKLAIQVLKSKWGGELDSFYDDLTNRITALQATPPGPDWDWTLTKEIAG